MFNNYYTMKALYKRSRLTEKAHLADWLLNGDKIFRNLASLSSLEYCFDQSGYIPQ